MDNLNPLLAERAQKVEQLRNRVADAESRGQVSAEDKTAIDAVSAEIRSLDDRIANHPNYTGGIPGVRALAATSADDADDAVALTAERSFAGWYEARHGGYGLAGDGFGSLDTRDFSLGKVAAAMSGRIDRRSLSDVEQRALAEGTDSAGGFMVPEFLASKVIDRVRAKAQVIAAGALTVPMDSDTLNIARLVGGSTAEWKAENAPVTESDQVYERVQLKTKTAVVLQRLSQELFDDLSPEGLRVIEGEIASALALKLDFAALRGNPATDPDEPRGIRNQAGVNIVSLGANGTKPTDFDFLIDAVAAIRDENGSASAAIMASRTQTTLDKLKDSTGQPLRQPEVVSDLRKLTSNQIPTDLAHGTSNDTSEVYVGGFENVLIGVRPQLGIRFRVLNERYADNLQIGLLAWLRADVALAHPEHLTVVTGVRP